MASIIRRKSKYSVVYYYNDENGEKRQRWETCNSHKEALRRKAEIENKIFEGVFIAPQAQTVSDFLWDFVHLYGEKKWGVSVYDSNTALISNYINPIIGDLKVQDITPKYVDQFYQQLQKTKSVVSRNRKPRNEYVAPPTIEKIHKLLKCAFKQAVRWEMIARNPFEFATIPKVTYKKRDIWTADNIRIALDECREPKLYIAMNLAFACSLRIGEVLGLTWDNVHISNEDIQADNAHIFVEKELARASKQAMDALGDKEIIKVFPSLYPNTSTRLIFKTPKTDSSVRKVWLPKTVAYILRKWKQSQDELREILGEEYQDYNIVVAQPNGRPTENRLIEDAFVELKKRAGLPNVVFHSLRHSSTTYKLKLNHGDLKATQGDTGHAQIDMITKVYAHILDEDRKINAQKFDMAFYKGPDLRKVEIPQDKAPTIDLQALVEQLKQSPELASTLAALIAK
ncbi:site-specific integrase [Ruminococcaceae bacterium OttesenSCG-928-A16]|nr:site-specific integrase [Ruminococcaceae bacterium OttesenSCG-928-A16]